jgi:hypothetical protein
VNYNQLRISTDGWIAFGSGTQVAPVNNTMPFNDNVNNMVAIFWDDLYEGDAIDGDIWYYHDAANHRFIVEWDSITHNDYQSEPLKEVFQVILLDPAHYTTYTGDGEIVCQYKKVEEIESNTIGIENNTQTIGLQYVYNNDYDPTALGLEKGMAIKFTTEAPYGYLYVGIEDEQNFNVNGFTLGQNQPNPFSDNTTINYSLPEAANLILSIYNVQGKLVRSLYNGPQQAGNHSMDWNGTDDNGNELNAGIYFYQLQTEGFVKTMKMFMHR